MAGIVIKGEHGKDESGKWAGPGEQFGFMGRTMGTLGQTESRARARIIGQHFRLPQKWASSTCYSM